MCCSFFIVLIIIIITINIITIKQEDFRYYAQNCVFYPEQATAVTKERLIELQRTASVGMFAIF